MADMATPAASSAPSNELNAAYDAAIALSHAAGSRMKNADAAVKSAEKALASAVKEAAAARVEATAANVVLDAASAAVNGVQAKVPWYVWAAGGALVVI